MMLKVINVVGARPNFMKIAPIIEAMKCQPTRFNPLLVHTGQHYDHRMSNAFFEELNIPAPNVDLDIGSGTHAEQTGRVMMAFEKVCTHERPDLVVVVGDVNSTLACAVTAKKLGIRVAHVEAGLRSRDMKMPEEINRICTDAISDYLFTTDMGANVNLEREGVLREKVFYVGNVMIDTLLKHCELAKKLDLVRELGLEFKGYATVTLHRPSNVDDRAVLRGILEALVAIGKEMPVVFPIHPRTRNMVEKYDLMQFLNTAGIRMMEPLGYLEFLHLIMHSFMVLTDSGGLQEETTALGVPCITLRKNTERPITCQQGTNFLAGNDFGEILEAARNVIRNGGMTTWCMPDKWDGHAGERIVSCLAQIQ